MLQPATARRWSEPPADPVPQWAGSWVLSLRPAAHAFLSAPGSPLSLRTLSPARFCPPAGCRFPLTSVTLFALKSCSTPCLKLPDVPSLYSRILSYSYRTFSAKCRTARPPSSPCKAGTHESWLWPEYSHGSGRFPYLPVFHHCYRKAQLGALNRRHITAGTCSYDNQIKYICHLSSYCRQRAPERV